MVSRSCVLDRGTMAIDAEDFGPMYDDQATDVRRDTGRGASLVYARWGIAPLVVILAAAATAADRVTGAEPVLLGVSQIGATGPPNAFTDLVRYRERWFCVYREGAGHAEGAGKIRVLTDPNNTRLNSTH